MFIDENMDLNIENLVCFCGSS